jgi:hypothetical protein
MNSAKEMAQVLANLSNKELSESFPVFYELLELKLKKREKSDQRRPLVIPHAKNE